MKYLICTLFLLLTPLVFLFPQSASALGLDCSITPNATDCSCFITVPSSSMLTSGTQPTEAMCLAHCTAVGASSYQFDECNGTEKIAGSTKAIAVVAPLAPGQVCTGGGVCLCEYWPSGGQTGAGADTPTIGPPTSGTSSTTDECTQNCTDPSRGVYFSSFACSAYEPAPPEETLPYTPVIPILNVPIPGLDFTGAVTKTADGNISSNIVGLYLQAVYRYLLVAGSIMAVVMLMVGGLEYAVSGGSSKRLAKGKKRITNALVGLLILFAAYDLAFLINPATVSFAPLELQYIQTVPTIELEEDPDVLSASPTDISAPLDPNLTTVSGHSADHIIAATSNDRISVSVMDQFKIAAKAYFDAYGTNIKVTSASRSVEKQATLFYDYCLAKGGKCHPSACDPTGSTSSRSSVLSYYKGVGFIPKGELTGVTSRSEAIAILVANGDPRNCPHTSNVAVDIWPEGSGGYTANVEEMGNLIATMTSNGFCRLNSEAWHFELETNKVSKSSCKTSNNTATVSGHNPTGCLKYNFKEFCCVQDDSSDSNIYPTMCK